MVLVFLAMSPMCKGERYVTHTYIILFMLFPGQMTTATFNGSVIPNGGNIFVTEGTDLVFSCSSSSNVADLNDIVTSPVIDVESDPSVPSPTVQYTVRNISRSANNTLFTCQDGSSSAFFSVFVQCKFKSYRGEKFLRF